MLFFAERLDELLFHHSMDTYRYDALSIRSLSFEYCTVYQDVKAGLLNKKNLDHILEEFVVNLKSDDIAKEILSEEYVQYFLKHYKSWNTKEQYQNLKFILKKLSNKIYLKRIIKYLKKLIIDNKQKRDIDRLSASLVRELLDCGYNENYIYQNLHDVFFHQVVSSTSSLDKFFDCFSFEQHKYDVYIGYSTDISSLLPLFEKIGISDLKVSILDKASVPTGIKTRKIRTILKFEGIESYDMYSAFQIADNISSCVVNSYSFYRHDSQTILTYGQVRDEKHNITTIKRQNLLKHRVSALSREESTKNADSLVKVHFGSFENLNNFSRITRIHNSAVCSDNVSDSILSLWSLLELIVGSDNDITENNSIDNEKERSKINNVISCTIPYLKTAYIQKLVYTCMLDIKRWNANFFDSVISNNDFGKNDLEHMFAFLTFSNLQPDRDKLYAATEKYPLLKNRVCVLSENLMESKHIKDLLNRHIERVTWHLFRIYRARNYIIHDANNNESLNQELVINLHSYVDTIIAGIIEQINNSPFNDEIHDATVSRKLKCLIMDEKLDTQENEKITSKNALRYLYYDFEQ